MYWTLELASKLEDAPWPASKDELIDYAMRSGAPMEVVENLQELEDEGEIYETIEDVWPDYPTKEDFLFNEDEYEAYEQDLLQTAADMHIHVRRCCFVLLSVDFPICLRGRYIGARGPPKA